MGREHLYRDSLGTFYGLTDGEGGRPVYVPAHRVAQWRQVMAEFEQVQDEMQAAYAEAVTRDTAAAEVRKAEQAVADAQDRLEQIRYEQEHPPENPESWPVARPVGHPEPRECRGNRRYVSEEKAWEGRVEVYDTVVRRGGQMTFDVAPYVCVEGHWHLGRTS